ncbi:MAG: HAMP domain-containing protein [Deltaproteobacteria bacterium]|nr:HAMP domain-containing protein [Deltaproteobacteria bacterium]
MSARRARAARPRPPLGRFERRILLAILAVGVVSIAVALVLGRMVIRDAIGVGLNERVKQHVERSPAVHRALIEARRDLALVCARAILDARDVHDAVAAGDRASLEATVRRDLARCASVARVHVTAADGATILDVRIADRLDPERNRLRLVSRDVVTEARGTVHMEVTVGIEARLFEEHARAGEVEEDYGLLARARDELERLFLLGFTVSLGLVTLLAVAVGVIVARRVTRRVGDLAGAVRRVGAGDLSVRVPVASDDEIAELTRAFNEMVRELGESRERIEYLSRVGAWQEFARRLAHEIKNPLTPIQLAIQQVHSTWGSLARDGDASAQTADKERYTKTIEDARVIIEEEVATLRALVGEFSAFAKLPEANLVPADLTELARDWEQSLSHVAASDEAVRPIELRWELPAGAVPVRADAMMLKRVVDNLVRNAVQALRERGGSASGHVVVEVRTAGERAELVVRDDGPGVAPEARSKVFDPYFTTRSEGTGLGLAIVRKVVLEHGGDVVCKAAPEGGAMFVITLPLDA